jgi:hypothetical protein
MSEWISIKHQLPPQDRQVKYRYPCGSSDVGVIDIAFIKQHKITHWSENTWYLFPPDKTEGKDD